MIIKRQVKKNDHFPKNQVDICRPLLNEYADGQHQEEIHLQDPESHHRKREHGKNNVLQNGEIEEVIKIFIRRSLYCMPDYQIPGCKG